MEKDRIEVSKLYFIDDRKATCASFLSTGHEFSKSAEIIFDKNGGNLVPENTKVIYYLIGHSLELIYKAFLHNTGYDIKKLKDRSLGHNLENLSLGAKKQGLDILSKEEEAAINELNQYYSSTSLGYDDTDFELKAPRFFFDIEEKLHNEVKKILKI